MALALLHARRRQRRAALGLLGGCRPGFFKRVLLKDPNGLLVAPGENARSSPTLNFTGVAEVERLATVIAEYIREAIELEKSGLKVELPKDDLDPPAELVAFLDRDDALRTAFEALAPGRRRGWTCISRSRSNPPRARRGSGRQHPASTPARACTTAEPRRARQFAPARLRSPTSG